MLKLSVNSGGLITPETGDLDTLYAQINNSILIQPNTPEWDEFIAGPKR